MIPGANRVFTEFACKSQRLQVCINKHTARFNSLTIIVTFFLFPFTILKRQLLGHWSVLLLISKYNLNYYLKASKAISQLKIRRESTPAKANYIESLLVRCSYLIPVSFELQC